MGITLHRGVFLAVVLIVAGSAFLLAYRVTSASDANALNHGVAASGIPYWPNAYQITRNYTYYVTEHTQSIVRWNDKTPHDFLHLWDTDHDAGEMRQYMVYTGSGLDILLGAYFNQSSCQQRVDNDPAAGDVPTFMWAWSPNNNDFEMTVVCLNVTVLGFTVRPFDLLSAAKRIRGVSHEMGHSLHLWHDVNGVMNTCFCNNITQHEADLIHDTYNAAP